MFGATPPGVPTGCTEQIAQKIMSQRNACTQPFYKSGCDNPQQAVARFVFISYFIIHPSSLPRSGLPLVTVLISSIM
jgi:hypothetical protein